MQPGTVGSSKQCYDCVTQLLQGWEKIQFVPDICFTECSLGQLRTLDDSVGSKAASYRSMCQGRYPCVQRRGSFSFSIALPDNSIVYVCACLWFVCETERDAALIMPKDRDFEGGGAWKEPSKGCRSVTAWLGVPSTKTRAVVCENVCRVNTCKNFYSDLPNMSGKAL